MTINKVPNPNKARALLRPIVSISKTVASSAEQILLFRRLA